LRNVNFTPAQGGSPLNGGGSGGRAPSAAAAGGVWDRAEVKVVPQARERESALALSRGGHACFQRDGGEAVVQPRPRWQVPVEWCRQLPEDDVRDPANPVERAHTHTSIYTHRSCCSTRVLWSITSPIPVATPTGTCTRCLLSPAWPRSDTLHPAPCSISPPAPCVIVVGTYAGRTSETRRAVSRHWPSRPGVAWQRQRTTSPQTQASSRSML
jgi:hypothetical protein